MRFNSTIFYLREGEKILASIKEKPWNQGLIAGICGILSFAIPAVIGSLEGVFYGVWMWGLYSGSMEGVTVTIYLPEAIGLIVSIIILVSSIILCITGIKARKLKRRDKALGIIWTILGSIMLLLQILYLVYKWTIFMLPGASIQLGIYFSIWAGSFALISGIIMIKSLPESKISIDISESKKEPNLLYLMRTSKEIDENGKEIISTICANCGEKNNFTKKESGIFHCLKCGTDHYLRD